MARVCSALRTVLPAVVVLVSAWCAYGQDADTDKAKRLLTQGAGQFKALNYRAAKTTLMAADRDSLSEADRKTLDLHLGQVDTAIKEQLAAQEAYLAGSKAMSAGNSKLAAEQFRLAADSNRLHEELRLKARSELAKAEAQMEVMVAAAEPAPKSDAGPADPPKPVKAPVKKAPVKKAPVKQAPPPTGRRKKFQLLMARGKAALKVRRGREAAVYFEQALKIIPGNEDAMLQLAYARRLTETTGGQSAVSELERMNRVAQQAASLDFEKAMRRSLETLATADKAIDFDKASEDAQVALNVLNTNRVYYGPDAYREKLQKVKDRLRYISMRKDEWAQVQARMELERIKRAETIRARKEAQARREWLAALEKRARTMIADRNYKGAAEALREILRLDVNHYWAGDQLGMVEQMGYLRDQKRVAEHIGKERRESLLDIRRSEIPWHLEIVYPDEWREISIRRKPFAAAATAESEQDRIIRDKLQQRIDTIEFSDGELSQVVQFIRDQSGLNIHPKWPVLEGANVKPDTSVTINLKNVTVDKALRVILGDLGAAETELSYDIDEGVVTISTKIDLGGRTIHRTYDIRDILVTIPDFIGPRIDVARLGQQDEEGEDAGLFDQVGDGDGLGAEGAEAVDTRLTKEQIVTQVLETIRSTIDPGSWREAGGEIGEIKVLHGQLIVTQTPANHELLIKLISDIREAHALQIAVESRWLTVTSAWLERIGVDIDFTFGPDAYPFGRHITFVPDADGHHVAQAHAGWATGVAGLTGSITDTAPTAITIQGSFLDDIQVDFLIEATQATENGRVLTAPRIMLMNGQRAYITIGEQRAYVDGFDPSVSGNAAALRPEISWIPTGIVLDVEATVSADRRYVTMTVRPQVSELLALTQVNFGALGGFVMLPTVRLEDLQSTVSVPDCGTVLLGGMKTAGQYEREAGVPILSKIPIINRLFLTRAVVRDEETLLILVSPKIIIQREMEDLRFPPPQPYWPHGVGLTGMSMGP